MEDTVPAFLISSELPPTPRIIAWGGQGGARKKQAAPNVQNVFVLPLSFSFILNHPVSTGE